MHIAQWRSHRLVKSLVAGTALAAGVIGVQVVAHAAIPQTGYLKICKAAAGPGVTGSFQFTVSGVKSVVTVPVGGCSASIVAPQGQVTVTEIAQVWIAVADVTASPVGRLVSKAPSARKAVVKVPAGSVASQTVVTFTNKAVPTGVVQVCKKAAAGDPLTGSFTFMVAASGVTTKVPVAVGACSSPIRATAGTATVTEAARAGTAVTAIDVAPADRAVSSSVANRTATVKVVAAATPTSPLVATVVTFTNKTLPPSPTPSASASASPKPTASASVSPKPTGSASASPKPTASASASPKPTGCVRTKGYYKNHPDVVKKLVAAHGGSLAIGGVALTPTQIDAIYGRDASNFLNQVSQQLITARLNQLTGASTPAGAQTAIDAAQALVKQAGGPLTGTATSQTTVVVNGVMYTAAQLVNRLTAYNEGGTAGAPPACR